MQELAVLTSRALVTARQFTAVADNVANVNTDGFRKLRVDFREVTAGARGQPTASYVADRGIYADFSSGALQETGNPLTAAISGGGFFAVQVGGAVQYTRNGTFLINPEGTLVDTAGNAVLDNAFGEIQVPAGATQILIARDGTISTEEGVLAQLGIFTFNDEELPQLQRAGKTGFAAPGLTPLAVENPLVVQGKVESSNVDAVGEVVTMQTASRAYQGALGLLRSLEQLEQSAIRNLRTTP